VILLREAWRGNPEARTIAVGGLALVLAEIAVLSEQILGLSLGIDIDWAPFGFAAVLVSMAFSLSSRFRRVHRELDQLRLHLEEKVKSRTEALEIAKEEALAASRVKSQFLATVSHEVRDPMTIVAWNLELLSGTALSEAQRRYVERITKSGETLRALMKDILDLSKLESGRVTIERTPFGVRRLLQECVDFVTHEAERKLLKVAVLVDESVPSHVVGDAPRIRQILGNLLTNAIKFTEQGAVEASVGGQPASDGQFELRFSVRDTGIGIPEEKHKQLFDAFYQVDAAASKKLGGTGLGLAICRSLAELMGGTVWVESTPGEGSTFHFTTLVEPVTEQKATT
jgi:signal transduction histidine kinase